ncbi:MAG TPA: DUF4276 family protein [Verrucomicrobiae bacterium]|jgi:hypothetical protein
MRRLLIHVEGETEETFVNEVLKPHLCGFGYENVGARLIGNARQRDKRGGIRSWSSTRSDILQHLKEDAHCLATTMVDYYGLPHNGPKAWPGRAAAGALPFNQKAATVEKALLADISAGLGDSSAQNRFIPFVTMHEFEGLLFSDREGFAGAIGKPEIANDFQEVRELFDSPEEINDSPITAPSKRIQSLIPNYEKPLFGALAILAIGLERIRAECPHFNSWLSHLERLPND